MLSTADSMLANHESLSSGVNTFYTPQSLGLEGFINIYPSSNSTLMIEKHSICLWDSASLFEINADNSHLKDNN